MIARLRRSLGARILLLAGLNVLLLIVIGMAASGVRLPRSVGELVMQSARERLLDVSRRIALDAERTPVAEADTLLERYNREYRTRFLLVLNDGTHVAGVRLTLPPEVIRGLSGPPPGPPNGPGADSRRPRPGGRPPGFAGDPPDRMAPAGPQSGPRLPQTPPILISTRGGPRTWILVRTPIRFAGASEIMPGTLIIVPTYGANDRLLFPIRWLWWGLAVLAVTTACWWPFLRGITRSLRQMEHATGQIAEGRFATRLGIARADEIGRLGGSIERMAGRLGALVSGQKRFLGDTAHELRSPLGRMQVALEILHTRVPAAEQAYVRDLKEDVEALSALTNDLLQYAQAELADRTEAMRPVRVAEAIAAVVARETAAGVTFEVLVPAGSVVMADPSLFDRTIANLVRNAVKYAGAAGPIEITAAKDAGATVITVADAGPGVAEESLGRILDPFYREDAARNRKTGGVGLGLAIARSAVEACGGTISCRNRQPHGLEVRLVFPDA
ncbi:MAG: HAMP domain-containing sensor histidine kinase [Vicinamibacterales bacterium]